MGIHASIREASLFIGMTGSCKKRQGLAFFFSLKNAGS